jgi:hypothetical protein
MIALQNHDLVALPAFLCHRRPPVLVSALLAAIFKAGHYPATTA